MLTVSVIVPAFNCADLLDHQLAALAHQDCEGGWEVLVGDNGSTDHIADVIARWAERGLAVRRVDASARRGPAAARNLAVATSEAELIAFADADDEVAPGWLATHVAALETVDVVAGSVDFQRMQGGEKVVPHDASPRQFGYLPAGLGANLAVRRAAFVAMNGFDEDLIVGEDVDLCWRLQLAGHRFAHDPGALVHKRERETTADLRRQWYAYGLGDPVLYRRFRANGMPRATQLTLKTYAWLLVNALPAIVCGRRRDRWLKVFALRAGRVVGSVRNRVLYL